MRSSFHFVSALTFLLTGCSDDASGSGEVAIDTWGEEYIEDGIPSAEFEDGGSATFSKFLIVIGPVTLADVQDGEAGRIAEPAVYDLAAPGPHAVGTLTGIPARTHDAFGYHVTPATGATTVHVSASPADADMMASMGYSIYVEGLVSHGGADKVFSWGFDAATHYANCVDVSSGQELPGVVVVDGNRSDAQVTIHGDHFFYDDLLSTDAKLRAQHIVAADADGDGEVTMAELEAVPLADIPAEEGPYGVGASDVNDLGAYVRAATHTLGHFNGEGHCEVHAQGG